MRIRVSSISLASVLVAAFLLAACGTKWETVNGPGFTVEMPGSTKQQSQSVNTGGGPIAVQMFTVETGGEAFVVGVNELPADTPGLNNPEEILNRTRDGQVNSINGKMSNERSLTLEGRPGKEYTGEVTKPQEGVFTARIYLDKPRLYQVLYLRPKGKDVSENGRKFLDSFKLTGK